MIKHRKQHQNSDTLKWYRNKKCMRYLALVPVVLSFVISMKVLHLVPRGKKLDKITVKANKAAVNDKPKKINELEKSTNPVPPDAETNIIGIKSIADVNEQNKMKALKKSTNPEPPDEKININGIKSIADVENEQKKINGLKKSPTPILPNSKIILEPVFGSHRPDANAIFTTAHGYKVFDFYVYFETLRETGYDGDVVLSISKNESKQVMRYLRSLPNVVVYMPSLECIMGQKEACCGGQKRLACQFSDLYGDATSGEPIPDLRKTRSMPIARFDLFYAWSLQYSPNSLIFTSDFRDSFFQKNPVAELSLEDDASLYFFEDARAKDMVYGGHPDFNDPLMLKAYGKDYLNKIKGNAIICAGWTVGKALSMQILLTAIIKEFDETQCLVFGCDQQFLNYLVYSNKLSKSYKRNLHIFRQGKGLVNNLAFFHDKDIKSLGILKGGKVFNWDGSLSPIVHHYTYCKQLRKEMSKRYFRFSRVYAGAPISNVQK